MYFVEYSPLDGSYDTTPYGFGNILGEPQHQVRPEHLNTHYEGLSATTCLLRQGAITNSLVQSLYNKTMKSAGSSH